MGTGLLVCDLALEIEPVAIGSFAYGKGNVEGDDRAGLGWSERVICPCDGRFEAPGDLCWSWAAIW